MNLAVVIGLASIFVPLAFVGWNMSVPRRTLKPWVERLVTGSERRARFSFARGRRTALARHERPSSFVCAVCADVPLTPAATAPGRRGRRRRSGLRAVRFGVFRAALERLRG